MEGGSDPEDRYSLAGFEFRSWVYCIKIRLPRLLQNFQDGTFMKFGRSRVHNRSECVGVPPFFSDDFSQIHLCRPKLDHRDLLSHYFFYHNFFGIFSKSSSNHLNQFLDLNVIHDFPVQWDKTAIGALCSADANILTLQASLIRTRCDFLVFWRQQIRFNKQRRIPHGYEMLE